MLPDLMDRMRLPGAGGDDGPGLGIRSADAEISSGTVGVVDQEQGGTLRAVQDSVPEIRGQIVEFKADLPERELPFPDQMMEEVAGSREGDDGMKVRRVGPQASDQIIHSDTDFSVRAFQDHQARLIGQILSSGRGKVVRVAVGFRDHMDAEI